jgi:hypothetical protein
MQKIISSGLGTSQFKKKAGSYLSINNLKI